MRLLKALLPSAAIQFLCLIFLNTKLKNIVLYRNRTCGWWRQRDLSLSLGPCHLLALSWKASYWNNWSYWSKSHFTHLWMYITTYLFSIIIMGGYGIIGEVWCLCVVNTWSLLLALIIINSNNIIIYLINNGNKQVSHNHLQLQLNIYWVPKQWIIKLFNGEYKALN